MPHPGRLLLLTLTLLAALPHLPGCAMETRVVKGPWWEDLPADQTPGGGGRATQQARGTWAIPLERFTGADRQEEARAFVAHLQETTSVRDLWTDDVQGTATVYRGRYFDPSSDQARQALQHTRRIRLGDEQPFASTRLTSLGGDGGDRPSDPHDLRQFPGYYTLQIGYYDADFGRDFRQAAEQAVEQLREEGEEAYFYHGPHRSLITVGLFNYQEAFVTAADRVTPQAQVDTYSTPVRELQEKYPYNLGNGLTRIEYTSEGEKVGELHSFLVRVF